MDNAQESMLKQQIQNCIAAEINSPFIQCHIERLTEMVPGLFSVRAILSNHILCRCLATYAHGEVTVFLSAGFIKEMVLKPALSQYTTDHPWIMGI